MILEIFMLMKKMNLSHRAQKLLKLDKTRENITSKMHKLIMKSRK